MHKKKLVVLSGAGISAESGLKTFRDSDGLWEGFDLEEVATPRGWRKNPELVLDFYNMRRKNVLAAEPNAAHYGLAELENYYDVQIITQNIDDLHERAGSLNVLHLHGEIFKMCSEQDRRHVKEIRVNIKLGDLAPDGFQYRPDIVWFEEPVELIPVAMDIVSMAEILVIVGTSLVVYPAAGLINFAPYDIPKFIVDKKIPYTSAIPHLTAIEKPASEGIKELMEILEKH
ncbi:MAG: NAD-dependent deacylase [Chitinophagaceae bacterium]|jgi:NAD-dependent deacetylase|nr:NAD-dependent deacylase [Chitinophagaceae bacterium]